MIEVMTPQGMEEIETNLKEMLQNLLPKKTKKTRLRVPEALETLAQEEAARLIDMEAATKEAIAASSSPASSSSTRSTRSRGARACTGPTCRARACSATCCRSSRARRSTPSTARAHRPRPLHRLGRLPHREALDLIPEFQGRFPIRVELDAAHAGRLHPHPDRAENALIRQYTALLATEHVALVFRDDAIAELARIAALVNERTENIGARRLHTVMERLLDEIFVRRARDGRARGRDRRGLRARSG